MAIEEIIMADGHVKEIIPAEDEYLVDFKISPNLFRGKYATQGIVHLNAYLILGYIIDDFGDDHESRREWEIKLIGENGGIKGPVDIFLRAYSGLGYGKMWPLDRFMDDIVKEYVGNDAERIVQLVDEVKEQIPGTVGEYNGLNPKEKYAIVRNIKRNVYNLLEFLSQQSTK